MRCRGLRRGPPAPCQDADVVFSRRIGIRSSACGTLVAGDDDRVAAHSSLREIAVIRVFRGSISAETVCDTRLCRPDVLRRLPPRAPRQRIADLVANWRPQRDLWPSRGPTPGPCRPPLDTEMDDAPLLGRGNRAGSLLLDASSGSVREALPPLDTPPPPRELQPELVEGVLASARAPDKRCWRMHPPFDPAAGRRFRRRRSGCRRSRSPQCSGGELIRSRVAAEPRRTGGIDFCPRGVVYATCCPP